MPDLSCSTVSGNATGGPRAGTARYTLCNDALECFRRTDCAVNDPTSCYCGTVDSLSCAGLPAGGGQGACAREIEATMELTLPRDIVTRLSESPALGRMFCDQGFCNPVCFDPTN